MFVYILMKRYKQIQFYKTTEGGRQKDHRRWSTERPLKDHLRWSTIASPKVGDR